MFQNIIRRRRSCPPRIPFEKNVRRRWIRFNLRGAALTLCITSIALAITGPRLRQRVAEGKRDAIYDSYAARVGELSCSIGDWVGTDIYYDSEYLKHSHVDGYVFRTYRHKYSGQEVDLFLAFGKADQIATHTSDWFLDHPRRQIQSQVEPPVLTLDDQHQQHEFRYGRFFNSRFCFNNMFWAYTFDGNWNSPKLEMAKRLFFHRPFLYKLYLMERCDRTTDVDVAGSPAVAFAERLLPEINETLGWAGVVQADRNTSP